MGGDEPQVLSIQPRHRLRDVDPVPVRVDVGEDQVGCGRHLRMGQQHGIRLGGADRLVRDRGLHLLDVGDELGGRHVAAQEGLGAHHEHVRERSHGDERADLLLIGRLVAADPGAGQDGPESESLRQPGSGHQIPGETVEAQAVAVATGEKQELGEAVPLDGPAPIGVLPVHVGAEGAARKREGRLHEDRHVGASRARAIRCRVDERVDALEAGRRRVADATIRLDGDGPVGRVGDALDPGAVPEVVVVEHRDADRLPGPGGGPVGDGRTRDAHEDEGSGCKPRETPRLHGLLLGPGGPRGWIPRAEAFFRRPADPRGAPLPDPRPVRPCSPEGALETPFFRPGLRYPDAAGVGAVPELRPDLDICQWTVDEARAAAFDLPPDESRWERPGTAFVSRRLCAVIRWRRLRDRRVTGLERDLYQEVYRDLWQRFEDIWQSFCGSGRPEGWGAFEAYLHRTLERSLGKAIHRLGPRERVGADQDEGERADRTPQRGDPAGGARDARRLLAALDALAWHEREALLDRHMSGRSTDETATRLGLSRQGVYTLRHRALRRFRQEVIRVVGEDRLRSQGEDPLRERLVRERCLAGHRCLMFKIECLTARSFETVAKRVGGLTPQDVAQRLDVWAGQVAEALAQHGIATALDACLWEEEPRRAGRRSDRE